MSSLSPVACQGGTTDERHDEVLMKLDKFSFQHSQHLRHEATSAITPEQSFRDAHGFLEKELEKAE